MVKKPAKANVIPTIDTSSRSNSESSSGSRRRLGATKALRFKRFSRGVLGIRVKAIGKVTKPVLRRRPKYTAPSPTTEELLKDIDVFMAEYDDDFKRLAG